LRRRSLALDPKSLAMLAPDLDSDEDFNEPVFANDMIEESLNS